jgi:methionyl-tRNA synthetase
MFADEKMSKSRGNMQYPQPIARTLGIDALRYFLLREMVFGQDGNFSRDALLTRYNADLANGLGNLASRTVTMIVKYFEGSVPPPGAAPSAPDAELQVLFSNEKLQVILGHYENFQFSQALERIWDLISVLDKYLVVQKPWSLADDQAQRTRLGEILYNAAEGLRVIAVLASPVLPHASQTIWQQLGQRGSSSDQSLTNLTWGGLRAGTPMGEPAAIFPRMDKKEISERIETMEDEIRNPNAASAAAAPSAPAPSATAAAPAAVAAAPAGPVKIGIEDFAKVDMRVGVVKAAEKVQGADKLLKVMVDIGDEVRQIVSGIAESFAPEELLGKTVVIVTNLAPRKLRGVESNGMIVAATGPDGKAVLVTVAGEVPNGTRLK